MNAIAEKVKVDGNNIYYAEDGIIVRRSVMSDVYDLAGNMRESDRQEIWAAAHLLPIDALKSSVEKCLFCLTAEDKDGVILMFGINPPSILGSSAIIWMLASPRLDNFKMRFIRNSRRFIDMFLCFYPYLENFVDFRNLNSIKWLRFLGAVIEEKKPYGIDGLDFHHFYFTKGK